MLLAVVCVSTALSVARGQHSAIAGRILVRESGEPVGYASVSVLPHGDERLAGADGVFLLRNLTAGEVRLRFRHIGFAPKDTAFVVEANDTAHVRIEMTRLALELPTVVVNGACTDRTPFEEKPVVLAALFDQVKQNAERLRLLARERPFVLEEIRIRGFTTEDLRKVGIKARGPGFTTDTIVRQPLGKRPYVPRQILRPQGVMQPELADLADTAFTNNHCFWYSGQERFGSDSVIRVDFEPVPWLAREVDLEGSIFVRADGYQLVGLVTRLNLIPKDWRKSIQAYSTRARFKELVSGVPVIVELEITNTFRGASQPTVNQRSRMSVRWLDPPPE